MTKTIFARNTFVEKYFVLTIAVDGGNTRIKMARFSGAEPQEVLYFTDLSDLSRALAVLPPDTPIISSNVGKWNWQAVFAAFTRHLPLGVDTPLPLKMAYLSPETLGNDRRALAVAAHFAFPGRDALVIDLGTCITYDLVDAEGIYRGGGIAPGLKMRLRALHHFTARLPEVSPSQKELPLVGTSTVASIQSGTIEGLKAEVEGMLDRYRSQYPELMVVITGGDASYLAHLPKNNIFARPNFLLTGLYHILAFNVHGH